MSFTQRRLITQKTSFALSYSQLCICLVFNPTLCFPNSWFSFFTAVLRIFYIFSLITQGHINMGPPSDVFKQRVLLAKSNTNFWVVETKSYGLYKNSQFECCQRLPLLRFVPSCFLFRGMVRNGIPRVCFYFCSTERNSELFPLLLKGLEGNSESLLLFQFHGTEFRVVFSSAEGFGREFREFASIFGLRDGIPSCFLVRGRVRNGIPRISVPRNSRNSVGNNHLFRQFRLPRNYFFVGNSQP
jgi:hypothetical protein